MTGNATTNPPFVICVTIAQCNEYKIPTGEAGNLHNCADCSVMISGPTRDAITSPLVCDQCGMKRAEADPEGKAAMTGGYAQYRMAKDVRSIVARTAGNLTAHMREPDPQQDIRDAVAEAFSAANTAAACAVVLADDACLVPGSDVAKAFDAGNCALASCLLASFKAERKEGGLLEGFTSEQMLAIGQIVTTASDIATAHAEGRRPVA